MGLHVNKPNRLIGYDYSLDGYYFVTSCVASWHVLGVLGRETVQLNALGEIVQKQLLWLETRYSYVRIDEYVIMPDHIHIIVIIDRIWVHENQVKIKSLSELIGAFKTTASKKIHQTGCLKFAWQHSFHDHIIRNDMDLQRIRQYIRNNPIVGASRD